MSLTKIEGASGEARMDIAAWLDGLGLGQYAQSFRENEIDQRVLPNLTAEDLEDLEVMLVGHRRRLLDAIAALGTSAPVATSTGQTDGVAPRSDAERPGNCRTKAG